MKQNFHEKLDDQNWQIPSLSLGIDLIRLFPGLDLILKRPVESAQHDELKYQQQQQRRQQ